MTRPSRLICRILLALVSINHCATAAEAVELLYVALLDRVMTFDKSGNLLHSFPTSEQVRNIAVNENGEIFVLSASPELGSFIIEKYDRSGASQGVLLSVPLESSNLRGLEIGRDHNLYTNTPTSIQRYTQAGDPLGEFAPIPKPTTPGNPFAIVFDEIGNTYVPQAALIHKFDKHGQWLEAFSAAPPTPSFRELIFDLSIDSSGNLYALSYGRQIRKLDSVGHFVQTINLAPVPQFSALSIAVDGGDIFYAGGTTHGVREDGSDAVHEVRAYLTDGTPIGTLISGLPDAPFDLVIAEVVPEPGSAVLVCTSICGFVTIRALGGGVRKFAAGKRGR